MCWIPRAYSRSDRAPCWASVLSDTTLAEPGPGVLVQSLPEKYAGPLKVNDRIVELGGKVLKDAAEFAQILYHTFDEKPVVVMVARGKEHSGWRPRSN